MTARRRYLNLSAIALIPYSLLGTPALAQVVGPQRPNTPPEQAVAKFGQTIRLNIELALVNVTVTDPYRHVVTDLKKDDFRVFEDGIEEEIVDFGSEDVPVSVGVIVDMSGSMSEKMDNARQAVAQFLRTTNVGDEFFLVGVRNQAEMLSPFTSSMEEIQNQMIHASGDGPTALLDGIYLGLSQMRRAHNRKKALLIVSDGADNHSRYTEADVREFLKEADCQLYAIGIFDHLGWEPEERHGPKLLAQLTEMSGGRVFPVKHLNDLPDIAAKLGNELRNQYVIGYKPSDARRDGAWRKIKIRLSVPEGRPPLRVFAKTGYYAPGR